MLKKIQKWWWFVFKNRVVRKGNVGGFKYVFRNLTMDISTVSGNFKGRWTADEHPYAYLLAGGDEENIHGFAMLVYMVSKLLTSDQIFVDDVQQALKKYEERVVKHADATEDETEEKIALEEVKAVQEYVELPKKERKKVERGIDGRFKKAVAQSLKEKEA